MNIFLYVVTIMIWGSTWLAIQFQLGVVSPVWSLIYRFGLAVILLWVYTAITRLPMKFTRTQHALMFFQGLFLFSLNYLLFYMGSAYFISGLVSILFASIILMNMFNARIFLKTPLSGKVFIGAIFGIVGLVFVFSSQFTLLSVHQLSQHDYILGALFCLGGTLFASFGNIISAFSQRNSIPVIQGNVFSMLYAVFILMVYALLTNESPTFDFSMKYTLSLLYLSVFGSLIAFGAYLKLLGRIGPGRAAYAFVVLPIVSLAISTFYEAFAWTQMTFLGVFFIFLGNLLVLLPQKLLLFSNLLTFFLDKARLRSSS